MNIKTIATALSVMALAGALTATPAWARGHPLYTPEPIATQGLGKARVEKGIKKALFRRNWKARNLSADTLRATYVKHSGGRTHKAVVDVSYGGGSIRIRYVDSEGLNYDSQSGTIHGTYNRWIRNMEKDFRIALELY